MKNFQIGQTVEWTAGGKVSRLDGVHGTQVRGVVQDVYPNGTADRGVPALKVRKHHTSLVQHGVVDMADATVVDDPNANSPYDGMEFFVVSLDIPAGKRHCVVYYDPDADIVRCTGRYRLGAEALKIKHELNAALDVDGCTTTSANSKLNSAIEVFTKTEEN